MIKNTSILLQSLMYLAFFLGIFACSTNQSPTNVEQQQALKHLVFFQFKEEVSEKEKEQAIQRFLDLEEVIPEIKRFEGGENINEAGLNKGFTHCFILTFENEAARDIYLPHPAHTRVVEQNKPLLGDLLVVDVWGED